MVHHHHQRGPYSRSPYYRRGRGAGGGAACLFCPDPEPYGRGARAYGSTRWSYVAAPYVKPWLQAERVQPQRPHRHRLRVLDMPDPDAPLDLPAMREIDEFRLPRGFTVKRKSSHTLRRWHTVRGTGVLAYIATAYGGRRSFSVMLQVNATIGSASSAVANYRNVSLLCWPVTVGMDDPSSSAMAVNCKPSEEVNYGAVGGAHLAPAPAPMLA